MFNLGLQENAAEQSVNITSSCARPAGVILQFHSMTYHSSAMGPLFYLLSSISFA